MKKFLLLVLMTTMVTGAFAQNYLGFRNSNYAGILGATLNPSFMTTSRLNWDVSLISGNIDFDNNFLYIPKDSLTFLGFGNIIDNVKKFNNYFDKGYKNRFDPADKDKTYDFYYTMQLMGPSFMFKFGKNKNALGFTSGFRFYQVMNNVPGHQAELIYTENRDSTLFGTAWNDDDAREDIMSWFEYGLSYSRQIYQKGQHQLDGGISLKYLQGNVGGFVKNVTGDYLVADKTDLYFEGANLDYGRVLYDSLGFAFNGDNWKINTGNYKDLINGHGFGGSIGFTYSHLKDSADFTYEMDCKTWVDPNRSNYLWRVGVALTDIGRINFDEGANTFHLQTDSANWHGYRGAQFSSHLDFDHALSYIFYGDSLASITDDHFTMSLPTTLNITFDWNIYKNLFVNATIIKGFYPGSGQGVQHPDVYALTPSFQQKWFEVSVPVSLISYHHLQPRVGLCLRAGWFYVGGDALGGLFGMSDLEGMDVYGGVHIFFPHHKLHDSDSDMVSNKLDSCPKEKGPCISHGCPDRDHDGIIDKLDRCPDDPGLPFLHGCPDRDNDSIADLDDSCPDIRGLIQFHGCPDTDDDGIPDPQDSCPTVKGIAQFHGCPDTDGDGVPDSRDSCPTVKGLPQFHGCPDRDGDGVPDYKDKCPDEPGLPENDGCPKPVAVQSDDMNRIQLSSQSILFKTGSNVLEPSVFQVLDQIALIMAKYPNTKWRVEGYCDNTGSVQINLDLSNRRAETVKDYLVKKGVKPENIASYGYGKTNFIATNATAAGRAKNRRVEIKEQK